MRQALTKIAVALGLVLASPARGDNPPADGEAPIARARRLIQAGDRPAAVTLLEDALIDGPAGDRPAALDLLRQSYEVMAREAEASGRADDAARYRDNLAILGRARESDRPTPVPGTSPEAPRTPAKSAPKAPARPAPKAPVKPAPEATRPVVKPTPKPAGRPAMPKANEPAATTDVAIPEPPARVDPPPPFRPPVLQAPKLEPIVADPSLGEPAALPEPPRLPMPGPMPQGPSGSSGQGMTRVPRTNAPIGAANEGTGEIPMTPPAGLDRPADPDELDPREAMTNPGAAAGEAAPAAAPRRRGDPRRPPAVRPRRWRRRRSHPDWPRPIACSWPGDGTSRAASMGRWPPATCCRRSGGRTGPIADTRPSSAGSTSGRIRVGSGTRSRAEIRSIQRLTPGLWYGDYLMNKVAEVRKAKRRPATADSMVVRGSAPDEPSPQIQQQPQAPSQTQPPTQASHSRPLAVASLAGRAGRRRPSHPPRPPTPPRGCRPCPPPTRA